MNGFNVNKRLYHLKIEIINSFLVKSNLCQHHIDSRMFALENYGYVQSNEINRYAYTNRSNTDSTDSIPNIKPI